MEKLIELLNEYRENQWYKWWLVYWPFWAKQWDLNFIFNHTKFPFIKWLVEDDKIDRDKVNEKSEYKIYYSGTPREVKQTSIDGLLMLLSISDTPIDLLCSLLK